MQLEQGELLVLRRLLMDVQQAQQAFQAAQAAYQSYSALLEGKYGKKGKTMILDPDIGLIEYEKEDIPAVGDE